MPIDFFESGLGQIPNAEKVKNVLNAALNAVLPDQVIQNYVRREGKFLNFYSPIDLSKPARSIDLTKIQKVKIAGIGKAAGKMAKAIVEKLGDHHVEGLLALKHPFVGLPSTIQQIIGGHPVPSDGSLEAGQKFKLFLQETRPNDLVLFLISGGGSALVTLPEADITLEDIQDLTSSLLRSGATIQEINTIRKQIDQVKGGGLAKMSANGQSISLILSDVIGNPLDIIASGPTIEDPGTKQDALLMLKKFNLIDRISPRIIRFLSDQSAAVGQSRVAFPDVLNLVIGDNDLALTAALRQAKLEGFETYFIPGKYTQDVNEVKELFWQKTQQWKSKLSSGKPYCAIQGGEPTVKVSGSGKGGRNQQLALLFTKELTNANELFVSLATDGEDGPTDAAGAFTSVSIRKRAEGLGLNINEFLQNNDGYNYFAETQSLLRTGPTGTNVNDLLFLFGE